MKSKKKILIERAEKIFQDHWLSFTDIKIKDIVPNMFLSIDRNELLKRGVIVKRNKKWLFKPTGVKYVFRVFQNCLIHFDDDLTNRFLKKDREVEEINMNINRLNMFIEFSCLQDKLNNVNRKNSPQIKSLVASNQIYNLFREDV